MHRKAVLVFADPTGLDLARRHLPRCLRPLLSWRPLRSSAGAADVHFFTSVKCLAPEGYQCHLQRGATFAERLEAAAETIVRLGYDDIVFVGSDCPHLAERDISAAFAALTTKRLVVGPDHRGGCYLIALRACDVHLLTGIRWNRDRDRAQLCGRLTPSEILTLEVKQDVDTWADVRLLANAGHHLAFYVMSLVQLCRYTGTLFVDLTALRMRVRWQMPPPALATA